MADLRKAGIALYGLSLVLVGPWFTGSIYRGEQSFWVTDELDRALAESGAGGAVFVAVAYAVFYSGLFLIPYAALSIPFVNADPELRQYSRPTCTLTAIWIGATVILFHRPIIALIRAIPEGALMEWLGIAWLLAALAVAVLWWNLLRRAGAARGPGAA